MKILFVENRYKTTLWEIIGKEYEKAGHEIFFLIQNPVFKPNFGNCIVLPFPKNKKLKKEYTDDIKKIIAADRGLNYFGLKSDNFIFWYQEQIRNSITQINPDLVFGESTLFHELLTISECKKKKILYLHPSSCRYPTGRFSFYKYDTLEPFGNSGESFSKEDAESTINQIVKREKLPDYMNVIKSRISFADKILDKTNILLGYMIGERFNTPSPIKKNQLNRNFKKNITKWDSLSSNIDQISKSFCVLYPLQMQPEANIDVWGYPYNNQVRVIEWIVGQLNDGEILVIKPNPKSKYELSNSLFDLIEKFSDKIIMLAHNSKMTDIWDKVDLVVTVTGTISIECIFDNKPVIMFGQGLQNKVINCKAFTFKDDLRNIIVEIKSTKFPILSKNEKLEFLNQLVSTSFIGINGDGLHNINYLKNNQNINNVINSYFKILSIL